MPLRTNDVDDSDDGDGDDGYKNEGDGDDGDEEDEDYAGVGDEDVLFSAAVFFSLWLLLHFGLCVVHCIKLAICSGRGGAMTSTGRRKWSEVASCFLLLSC